jgi:RHS repeat-associated protein
MTYTHEPNGEIASITSATPGGAQMIYGYDALNRLKTVRDHQNDDTTYNYNASGSLQSFKMPNNVWHTYQYDWLNRLTNMTAGQSLNPRTYGYTVNLLGHRTSVTDDGVRTVGYAYDKLFRLTQESIVGDPNNLNGSIDYTYDAVGNRKTRTGTGNIAGQIPNDIYMYTANDWLHDSTLTPDPLDQYDNNGNTTKGILPDGTVANDQYDFENRLVHRVHATLAETNTIDIVYDGDGNRVAKTVTPYGGTAATTYYLVDTRNPTGYAQVLEEHTSTPSTPNTLTLQRIYIYGHDLISMDQDDGGTWKTSFYGYDGHGNVRQLFDTSGTIVTDTYDYDAFGTLIAATGSTPNNYLYTGEQYDPDVQLYYLRARYNNTATGRFWTMDSFEGNQMDPISLHKYVYANANPTNYIDPSGKWGLALLGSLLRVTYAYLAVSTVYRVGLLVVGAYAIFNLYNMYGRGTPVGATQIAKIARCRQLLQNARFPRHDYDAYAAQIGNIQFRMMESENLGYTPPGLTGRMYFGRTMFELDDKVFAGLLLHELVHYRHGHQSGIPMNERQAYQIQNDFYRDINLADGRNWNTILWFSGRYRSGPALYFWQNTAENMNTYGVIQP